MFVRILGPSTRSRGVNGVLLGAREIPVAGSSEGNPSCTKGGLSIVIISIVIIKLYVKICQNCYELKRQNGKIENETCL